MLMDSSLFLVIVVAAIGFFCLYKRFRFHPQTKDLDSSSSLTTTSSSSCKWTHDVFPSFHGKDVRRNFLSHIQKEFRRKGIVPFIDNDIKRGESIGLELIQAIRRSKVAVVLISKNYASSKWCLDELVEIMKCKEEFGQIVFAIFYDVDPSEVKKLTGDFGAVFKKTCVGKTKEEIRRWRQAFAEVATIAGYDSRTWENEAVMIEEIVNEISKRLIYSTPSSGFEGLIGMGAHMEKMKLLLCLGSNEVRMIGIWGPAGIGKTTIARVAYDHISGGFQLSVFMKMKPSYARPSCSDDHDVKLYLEQQFLSQLINQEDIKIPLLGAAQNFLMDKKVLVVLDGVDQLVQLLAMPKARCLGPGTRIIITTQDQKILKAFGITHIYKVEFPPHDEALQMFCMSAFGQNYPYKGFKKLAWEVTNLAGSLPLGLRVMGSHLRGMSKEEWKKELPRLRIRLDGEIGSILKLSYDALGEEDKNLFLYIACFFVEEGLNDDLFEDVLRHRFSNLCQGLKVLVQKSLVSYEDYYQMHDLLVQLGREIVRNQSIDEPGKRQFLVDDNDICEVLADNTGSRSVIGINLDISRIDDDQDISERAFEEMSNLQLLRFHHPYDCSYTRGYRRFYVPQGLNKLHLPQGLKYLPPKLRILHWDHYPLKSLPSNFNPKFLVKIRMKYSKLEKLWEGVQPLRNLKLMNLNNSNHLKELPDLSTATNLISMELKNCSNLVELPSSIGNLSSLEELILEGCFSLMNLPSSIGNVKCLLRLNLYLCSNLVELPSSIGKLTNLENLNLNGCSSLLQLPSSIGNIKCLPRLSACSLVEIPSYMENDDKNLHILNLDGCSSLVKLPSGIGNSKNLLTLNLYGCSSLVELPPSIGNAIQLKTLNLGYCSNLMELPSFIGNASNLEELVLDGLSRLVEVPCSIGNLTNLKKLSIRRCLRLVELPSSIANLTNLKELNLEKCSNLLGLPSSIGNIFNLQKLNICGLSCLTELPYSIGNLTNLYDFQLCHCSNLAKLPLSIGNLINLQDLDLDGCSSLEELPFSIGSLTNLQKLVLSDCSSLVVLPSSIGNLQMLWRLDLDSCSKLDVLPNNVNLDSLKVLDVTSCSQLRSFPEIFTNIQELKLRGTLIKDVPLSIKSWSKLKDFSITYRENLEEFPNLLDIITELELNDKEMEEIPPWVSQISCLHKLVINNCRKLVSITQLPGSVSSLIVENCDSLERLACSFPDSDINLTFVNCWKLNKEARDIIIKTLLWYQTAILPGREVPAFFTYRATTGGSLTVKLSQRCFPTSLRFKVCIFLVEKCGEGVRDEIYTHVSYSITDKQSGLNTVSHDRHPLCLLLTEHLYIFEVEAENVDSSELLLKFKAESDKWKIGGCGVREF